MFAGRPLANMIFKILSTDVVGQGLYFAADMKLAHYLKVPPRTLFFAQGLACFLGALTQCGVTLWMLGNITDICTSDQANGFSCPNGRVVYSSSVIWGAIGPGVCVPCKFSQTCSGPREKSSSNSPAAPLFIWQNLQWSSPFLLVGCALPRRHLAALEVPARVLDPNENPPVLYKLAFNLCGNVQRTASHWHQLLLLVPGQLHLQSTDLPPLLRLVDKVQLRHCRRAGHWAGHQWDSDIFRRCVSGRTVSGLVGKHGVAKYL